MLDDCGLSECSEASSIIFPKLELTPGYKSTTVTKIGDYIESNQQAGDYSEAYTITTEVMGRFDLLMFWFILLILCNMLNNLRLN